LLVPHLQIGGRGGELRVGGGERGGGPRRGLARRAQRLVHPPDQHRDGDEPGHRDEVARARRVQGARGGDDPVVDPEHAQHGREHAGPPAPVPGRERHRDEAEQEDRPGQHVREQDGEGDGDAGGEELPRRPARRGSAAASAAAASGQRHRPGRVGRAWRRNKARAPGAGPARNYADAPPAPSTAKRDSAVADAHVAFDVPGVVAAPAALGPIARGLQRLLPARPDAGPPRGAR
jgi:hypothetical protein